MARTKQVELVALAEQINERLGIEDPDQKYTIGRQGGSPRLHRALESVDVSPRLPAGPLGDWLRAFLDGISVGALHGVEEAAVAIVTAQAEARSGVPEDGVPYVVVSDEFDPVNGNELGMKLKLTAVVEGEAETTGDIVASYGLPTPRVVRHRVAGWHVCTGCHEEYNPDDFELHERCAE